jgi:alpha-tubulin suppressor-like RCC1 family protein
MFQPAKECCGFLFRSEVTTYLKRCAIASLTTVSIVLLYGCPPPPPPPPGGNLGVNRQALTGTLTIIVAGSGNGTVGPSLPPGIFSVSGPACDDIKRSCRTDFPPDAPNPVTSIELKAQAGTGNDSVFVGWAGACSGTGPTCTISTLGGITPVIALFRKTTVAAGAWFTCGLKTDGTVMCWGENDHGELGYGSTYSPTNGVAHQVTLPASRSAVDISANGYHACALLDDANVFCWGNADHGATGPTPGAIVPLPAPSTSVAAGGFHSCAAQVNGQVRCWGYGSDGQINGVPQTPDSATPLLVSAATGAIAVTAGAYHSCALRGTTQDLLCWGHNKDGELGPATPDYGVASSPFKPTLGGRIARIAGGVGAGVVGPSGGYNTCLQTTTGSVECRGNHNWRQIDPTLFSSKISGDTVFLANSLPRPLTSIAVGGYFMCAVGDDMRVYCWGDGSKSQLGNGAPVNSAVSSATVAAALPDQVWSVAAGAFHACAVLGHHKIKCWGQNNWGQTGAVSNGGNSDIPVTPSW